MTILIFVNKNQSIVLISLSGLSFLSIILQAFYALRSLNTSLVRSNSGKHGTYFFVKCIYIGVNCVKLCFKSSDIQESKDFSLFLIDLLWTIFEAYWSLILYMFCQRVKIGTYEFFEGVLDSENATQRINLKTALILETYGLKLKNPPQNEDFIDSSFPIISENRSVKGHFNAKEVQKVDNIVKYLIKFKTKRSIPPTKKKRGWNGLCGDNLLSNKKKGAREKKHKNTTNTYHFL